MLPSRLKPLLRLPPRLLMLPSRLKPLLRLLPRLLKKRSNSFFPIKNGASAPFFIACRIQKTEGSRQFFLSFPAISRKKTRSNRAFSTPPDEPEQRCLLLQLLQQQGENFLRSFRFIGATFIRQHLNNALLPGITNVDSVLHLGTRGRFGPLPEGQLG